MLDDQIFGDLLILDRIWIDPAWLGKGIGLAVLAITVDEVGRGCGLVALTPTPTEPKGMTDQQREAGSKALARYWRKLGCKRLGDSEVWVLDPTLRTWEQRMGRIVEAFAKRHET